MRPTSAWRSSRCRTFTGFMNGGMRDRYTCVCVPARVRRDTRGVCACARMRSSAARPRQMLRATPRRTRSPAHGHGYARRPSAARCPQTPSASPRAARWARRAASSDWQRAGLQQRRQHPEPPRRPPWRCAVVETRCRRCRCPSRVEGGAFLVHRAHASGGHTLACTPLSTPPPSPRSTNQAVQIGSLRREAARRPFPDSSRSLTPATILSPATTAAAAPLPSPRRAPRR